MKSFRSIAPDWVHTGSGSLTKLSTATAVLGAQRVFVMTTASLKNEVPHIESVLGGKHLTTYGECKQHSPSVTVEEASSLAANADAIIRFGGGSVIDTAKAVAALLDHIPQIAIPTTLSAGEFTPGIGITNEQTRVKDVSVDLQALPKVVIHDPEVTHATPRQLWLSSGIKALDHAVEMLWWPDAHPMTTLTASDAASRLLTWLPMSAETDLMEAREHCFLGAWMAIQALFTAGARLSHPVGHQLGSFWNIPNGITSCIALPASMRALDAITPVVGERVAPLFGATDGNSAADALTRLLQEFNLPTRLRDTSAVESQIPQVALAIEDEFHAMRREPEVDIGALLKSMW